MELRSIDWQVEYRPNDFKPKDFNVTQSSIDRITQSWIDRKIPRHSIPLILQSTERNQTNFFSLPELNWIWFKTGILFEQIQSSQSQIEQQSNSNSNSDKQASKTDQPSNMLRTSRCTSARTKDDSDKDASYAESEPSQVGSQGGSQGGS